MANKNITFQYVEPDENQKELMSIFRNNFEMLYAQIEGLVDDSKSKRLCQTKLEEASFWLNKAITHND